VRTPDVIRTNRLRLRLTQADLAREIGVDTRQINRYETGQTEPTLAVARRLAEKLRISMDELAGERAALNGIWFSAWHNLDADGGVRTGPVLATQQGRNLSVVPVRDTPHPHPGTEVAWNAEYYIDGDSLLGGYRIEDARWAEGGLMNLTHRNQLLEGAWRRLSVRNLSHGRLCLARGLETALERLNELVVEAASD